MTRELGSFIYYMTLLPMMIGADEFYKIVLQYLAYMYMFQLDIHQSSTTSTGYEDVSDRPLSMDTGSFNRSVQ